MAQRDYVEILINIIEKHQIIYDKSLPDYKDNEKRKKEWEEIATQFFINTNKEITVEKIQNAWKNLKAQYENELKKSNEYIYSGSEATDNTSTWKYFKAMSFLKNYPLHANTVSNFQLEKRAEKNLQPVEISSDSEEGKSESSDDCEAIEPETPQTIRNDNDYFLSIRDCWRRIAENKKIECYRKIKKMITDKKKLRD